MKIDCNQTTKLLTSRWHAGIFLLLTFVTLGMAGSVRAQLSSGHVLTGDRIILNGSFKPAATDASTAKRWQSTLVSPTLTREELATQLTFEVGLTMRDLPTLEAREAAGERITRAQLEANHLPSQADFNNVEKWLTSQGFTITRRDGHRLAIFARGTVTQIQQAFQTRFARVTFEGKNYVSNVTAPSVPASLTAVLGVVGLQPYEHKRAFRAPAVPAIDNAPPYLVSEILGAFGGANTPLTGEGQEIGIIIDAVPDFDDLTAFYTDNDSSQTTDNVDYEYTSDSTPDATSGEETLDVEWSSTVAPSATVYIFCTGTLNDADIDAAYSQVANELGDGDQPDMHQVSISFGGDEDGTSSDELSMDHNYFVTITSYGVTILVASGDNGAFDGNGDLSASSPASDTSVTAVGGTTVVLDKSTGVPTSITGWSADGKGDFGDRIGASGGGISDYFAKPSWQTGVGVPSTKYRCVPDIAASSDQNEAGLLVFTDPSSGTQYTNGGANGTSWAAPTWGGMIALINQGRADAGLPPLGLLNPTIYPFLGTANFRDITIGSNGHHGKNDGYSCTTGYDCVTGIGTPMLNNLAASLEATAPIITSAPSAAGAVGSSLGFRVTALGSNLTYAATNLPPGLSINKSSGLISGTPTTAGTYAMTITATDDAGGTSGKLTFTIRAAKPVITSADTANGAVGTALGFRITASGSPTSFNATNLPPGLKVSTSSGLISGTPTTAGTYGVTVSATSASGTGSATLTFSIRGPKPVITSASTANGDVGTALGFRITASNSPTSFSASDLPPGLSLSSSGLIEGTPTKVGTYDVTVGATNANGTGTATLTFTIRPAKPVITSASTAHGTVGTALGFRIAGSNSPTSFNATGLPPGLKVSTSSGLISGTPTTAGTYQVTVSATNAGGTGSATLTFTIAQ